MILSKNVLNDITDGFNKNIQKIKESRMLANNYILLEERTI